jgi:hypothetical protein
MKQEPLKVNEGTELRIEETAKFEERKAIDKNARRKTKR